MKKTFALIVCMTLLLSGFAGTAAADSDEELLADIVQDDIVFAESEPTEEMITVDSTVDDFDVDETDVWIEDEPTHLRGDVNADGKVNTVDFIVLFKLSSGDKSVRYDENAVDINGDGTKAGFDDVIRLMEYLAGANVEIY